MLGSIVARVPRPVRQALKDALLPGLLSEGETAPEWSLRDAEGDTHRHGDHWSLLIFYPADETPGCTRQLREAEALRPEFEALGCRIFGVNPADAASHRAFAAKEGLGFPLLVDEGAAVARQFHATWDLPFARDRILRSVYLVNPARKIRLANRGAPSLAAVLRSVQALQRATKAGM